MVPAVSVFATSLGPPVHGHLQSSKTLMQLEGRSIYLSVTQRKLRLEAPDYGHFTRKGRAGLQAWVWLSPQPVLPEILPG